MLDWKLVKGQNNYSLPLPLLSEDEEQFVGEISENFRELSKHKEIHGPGEARKIIESIISERCTSGAVRMSKEQRRYVADYVFFNIVGFNGLDLLLRDDDIEEISVIGLEKPVYVYHREHGWLQTNLVFRTVEGAVNIINKMARGLGRRVTYQNPKLNAILPDGSRLHASIPPISGVELTIRKFHPHPLTVGDLISRGTYPASAMAFLSLVFQSDYSVLIGGNTASGKTSSLNAMFSFVPPTERILIIEETPEISIPHKQIVKMVSNPEIGVDMKSLVQDSLRMRPDRIIVGEVRTSGEVSALIETILSGQARGSYATFHAQSAEEAVKRLVSLGVMQVDVSSIDFIVIQRRMMRYDITTKRYWEERHATEIVELVGQQPCLNHIFSYELRSGKMSCNIGKSKKLEQIADSFGLSHSELLQELSRREQFLASLSRKNLPFDEAVREIQTQFFGAEEEGKCSAKKKSMKPEEHCCARE